MVKIKSFETSHYYPTNFEGLEELVRFPDGEVKRNSIPNSTVWSFNGENHEYNSNILSNDVGCGIAAFLINGVDVKEATDKIYTHLKNKNILGRGNHFINIVSEMKNPYQEVSFGHNSNLLIVHSDGKSYDPSIPTNVEDAITKQKSAETFREDLGHTLAEIIGANSELVGNWTHNSVETSEKNGNIIYRKGVVKVEPNKLQFLPACIGQEVLFYTVDGENLPPYSSMPHATGRSKPRGEGKVSLEDANSLRDLIYIPEGISDSSLRTEHPSCFNGFEKIIESLGKYIVPVAESKILSYVGKV